MGPRLVLSMIVRNEGAVIEACLEAALPHVDGWVIVDTGSTDDTPARIQRATRGKPGSLRQGKAFSDFGTSRTEAAELARAWALEQRYDLDQAFLLWLDADMRIAVGPTFQRGELTEPHYELLEDDGAHRSFGTRLGRLSHAWRSVGVAHERWVPTPFVPPARLDSLSIADTPRAAEKLRRNQTLLTHGLAREPDNGHYWLHLADTYAELGMHAEAIPWCERRFAAGGADDEESWYARYRQGLSHLEVGQNDLGATVLLEAYARRPTRAEPLVALARHYRLQGQNVPAFRLATQAQKLPLPAADRLRVKKSAYGRDSLLELSITAYYLRQPELGLDACERLLALRDPVSLSEAADIARNELYYLPPSSKLERSGSVPVSRALATSPARHWGLAQPNTTEYVPKNPALVRLGERTWLNVSLVNYRHEHGRTFEPNDADGVVRTRSAVLEWDQERAAPTSEWESVIELPEGFVPAPTVRGLEDQRWVAHQGRVWLTATTYHVTGVEGQPQVVLGRMREDLSGIEWLTRLSYEHERSCEKNWLPWSLGGTLFLVYSYDPFVVLQVDTASGACTEVTRWTPPWSAARWRGGAPPVPHPTRPDRYVMLVHETVWLEQATVYLHRFVELSAHVGADGALEFRIERFSRLFAFHHVGVEYATGLLDRANGTLLVTYGSEECEARFAELDWREVDAMLERGPVGGGP